MAVPQASVLVPSQRQLTPSVTLVSLSTDDKGDNEMKPEAANRSPGIYLTGEEKSRKTSAWRPSMKTVDLFIASNGDSCPQMSSVGSHSSSGRQKQGKEEMTG